MKKNVIKNNFRILKKQYAYLQTILKASVKLEKDWPKTVAGRRMVGAMMDGRTDTKKSYCFSGFKGGVIKKFPFLKFNVAMAIKQNGHWS